MDFRIWREILFGERKITGIDDDGKIRPATEFVCGVNGFVVAPVEMRAERRGQVRSGGESEDTDALRINLPFGRVLTNDAKRALGVLQRGGVFGQWARIWHTVLQKNAG